MTNLKELELQGTQTGDEGLAHIGQIPSLELLIMWDTPITDVGLARLKGLINLQYL